MRKLKIALASFLIVNSFAMAENLTEFQTKAVKELYNKGILQGIVKEEDFGKKDNFSRGEIAAIIYNTVNLKNAETIKSATPQDVTILKALISDFSYELAKLGATDYELLEIINKQNETINKRIDSEVSILNKKIDRISVSGDFTLIKELNAKQSEEDSKTELMEDVKGEGEIALNFDISENLKGKIAFDLEKEEGEYDFTFNKDGLTVSVFNDDALLQEDWYKWNGKKYDETAKILVDDLDTDGNKKRYKNLRDAIESKKLPEFDNNLGIVSKAGINNKDTIVVKKEMNGKEVLALVTSTEEEDIYGAQFKKKMPYFMIGEGADANMVVSYVGLDDKNTVSKDKGFIILGADFKFPINGNATETLKYNYVKTDNSEIGTGNSDSNYSMPITSDEANFVYSKTEVNSKKMGMVDVTLGAVNTGYKFDASGLSDSEKELFSETDDLIKLDSNIFGGVAIIKNTKGNFENAFSSVTYKKNDNSEKDITTRIDTLYKVNDKVKLGIGVGENTETDDDDTTILYKRKFVEGQIQLKEVLSKDTTNVIKLKYGKEDNFDKNEFVAYVENKKTIDNRNYVLASEYEDSAEEKTIKAAFYYEKTGKFNDKKDGNILLGGRYDKGLDKEDTSNYGETYRIFTKFDVNLKENLVLEGGVRYGDSLTEADKKETNFAVGLTYKLSPNAKISGIYGPLTVLNDYSSNIFEYKTDGIYEDKVGDQDIASIRVAVKF